MTPAAPDDTPRWPWEVEAEQPDAPAEEHETVGVTTDDDTTPIVAADVEPDADTIAAISVPAPWAPPATPAWSVPTPAVETDEPAAEADPAPTSPEVASVPEPLVAAGEPIVVDAGAGADATDSGDAAPPSPPAFEVSATAVEPTHDVDEAAVVADPPFAAETFAAEPSVDAERSIVVGETFADPPVAADTFAAVDAAVDAVIDEPDAAPAADPPNVDTASAEAVVEPTPEPEITPGQDVVAPEEWSAAATEAPVEQDAPSWSTPSPDAPGEVADHDTAVEHAAPPSGWPVPGELATDAGPTAAAPSAAPTAEPEPDVALPESEADVEPAAAAVGDDDGAWPRRTPALDEIDAIVRRFQPIPPAPDVAPSEAPSVDDAPAAAWAPTADEPLLPAPPIAVADRAEDDAAAQQRASWDRPAVQAPEPAWAESTTTAVPARRPGRLVDPDRHPARSVAGLVVLIVVLGVSLAGLVGAAALALAQAVQRAVS